MPTNIQTIKTFSQLIKYLRTDLGWPVDEEDADSPTLEIFSATGKVDAAIESAGGWPLK